MLLKDKKQDLNKLKVLSCSRKEKQYKTANSRDFNLEIECSSNLNPNKVLLRIKQNNPKFT